MFWSFVDVLQDEYLWEGFKKHELGLSTQPMRGSGPEGVINPLTGFLELLYIDLNAPKPTKTFINHGLLVKLQS